jgi:hypothetical protein
MRKRIIVIGLSLSAAAASAQTSWPRANYQTISDVRGGWIWRLNTRTVRPAGTRTYRFWMTGENRGTGAIRRSMTQVKLACGTMQYIPLHVTTYDARGRILSDTTTGDHVSNWTRVVSGNPVDRARPWVCRG